MSKYTLAALLLASLTTITGFMSWRQKNKKKSYYNDLREYNEGKYE